ncbi:exonuclease domain-containing protein [Sinomonas sp. P10A9]|uniref:Exonuclease domain-containing protein n=1 Tax=Sinomonas puerhi TaxID=3238584 RepID=A0AB39L0N8_9MICC
MPLDFTAIDFETANGFRGSPCSVGLIRVRGGRVVERASWLMRPPAGHDEFDPRNVAIHGIRPDDVAQEPRFGDLFAEIGGFIGDDVLVAHNAAFDLGVIRSALEVSGMEAPAYDYACTVVLSRKTYRLVSHSLPFAAREAGVRLEHHHDATEDAAACAGILIDIAGRHRADTVEDVYRAVGLSLPRQAAFAPGEALSAATVRALAGSAASGPGVRTTARGGPGAPRTWAPWPDEGTNPPANSAADPHHPLFGQRVVFTGALGITRSEAKVRAAEVGAQPASSVTRATTVLVVGDGFVAADLASGRVTTKARKALQLRERGQRVEVLSEGEFLQMLGGHWPAASA